MFLVEHGYSWQNMGIRQISDLYSGNLLKPFTSLQEVFSIPATDYFKYMQIRHCILRNPHPHLYLHKTAWKYLSSDNSCFKGITIFYNLLQDKTTFVQSPPMIRWEKGIGHSFSPSQWSAAILTSNKAIPSSNLWELTLKFNLRWYSTPSQFHTFTPSAPPSCWRYCGEWGSLMHLLWSCNKLSSFCQEYLHLAITY